MGKFNDLFVSLKSLLTGPVPYGGTVVPASEEFPIGLAQNIKGGFFSVPDTDTLADLPYGLLGTGMEVTVLPHVIAGPTNVPLKKYRLFNLPPANTRVNEVPSYVISNYWEDITTEDTPADGEDGTNGWTPVYAGEADGTLREVIKIIDYFGGTGTKPALPPPATSYIGTTGFVSKSEARNYKGGPGAGLGASLLENSNLMNAAVGPTVISAGTTFTTNILEIGKGTNNVQTKNKKAIVFFALKANKVSSSGGDAILSVSFKMRKQDDVSIDQTTELFSFNESINSIHPRLIRIMDFVSIDVGFRYSFFFQVTTSGSSILRNNGGGKFILFDVGS